MQGCYWGINLLWICPDTISPLIHHKATLIDTTPTYLGSDYKIGRLQNNVVGAITFLFRTLGP